MLIRKATLQDATAIVDYILLAMEDILYTFIKERNRDKAKEILLQFIKQPENQYSYENCWVIEENQKILGAALVYDGACLHELRAPFITEIRAKYNPEFAPEDETEAGEYYIDCLAVHPDCQGKGLGSALLKFLIENFVVKQKQILGLLVEKENPGAKKLYLRLGFQIKGKKKLAGKELDHLQIKNADL